MKIKPSSYFLITIMVLMLALIGLSLRMEYFASKLLPVLVGSFVFLLAAIELRKEISARDDSRGTVARGETRVSAETRGALRGYLLTGAWIAGFFLAIYLLGFIVAVPLFVLSYMKSHGTRWVVALTCAIVMGAVVYGVFEFLLQLDLYRGLLSTWLGY